MCAIYYLSYLHIRNNCLCYVLYTIHIELLARQILDDLLNECYWQDFKLVVLSTVWKETHACSINSVRLI